MEYDNYLLSLIKQSFLFTIFSMKSFFFINCSLHLEIIRTCNTKSDRIQQFLDILLCDMIVFTLLDYCFVLRKEKEGRLEVLLLRFLFRIFFLTDENKKTKRRTYFGSL